MQFSIIKEAKAPFLKISGQSYVHLFCSRRTKKSQTIALRNLCDSQIYFYTIKNINKKEALLELSHSKHLPSIAPKNHLIWAIIDPKQIQKALPMLNELNLKKITFFYAQYSQKSFKLDLARMERILEHSCEQCGRDNLLEIECLDDLDAICKTYRDFCYLDTPSYEPSQSSPMANLQNYTRVLVGCEGGFSQEEREKLLNFEKFHAPCHILRSEHAALFAVARLLAL